MQDDEWTIQPGYMTLGIGSILKGYCGGYFGDSYEDKRVEACGSDWVVVRGVNSGEVNFASGETIHRSLWAIQQIED